MSFVIVELDWSLTPEELRKLTCELWAIQVAPVVAQLPPEASADHPKAKQFCQELVRLGLISLLVPVCPEPKPNLYGAFDLYQIAEGEITPEDFIPLWQSLKEVAAEQLNGS